MRAVCVSVKASTHTCIVKLIYIGQIYVRDLLEIVTTRGAFEQNNPPRKWSIFRASKSNLFVYERGIYNSAFGLLRCTADKISKMIILDLEVTQSVFI